jgi:hypothetical protein
MWKYSLILVMAVSVSLAAASTAGEAQQGESDAFGPTLHLEYTPKQLVNPVDVFMYFVPLNSLTAVSVQTAPDTRFAAGVVNWQRNDGRNNSFTLYCDFEITGSGLYKVVYEPNEMIDLVSRGKAGKSRITGLLDWIQLDGACRGRVVASGRIQSGEAEIEEVSISFNRDRQRSPVTIALYDVPRVEDRYDYGDRQNGTIARVNTLTFQRSDGAPRMSVEIASVHKAHQSEGLFSSITAMFANLLLSAQPVSVVGNETMLEFGLALFHKKAEFTFPVAETLTTSLENAQVAAF